MLPQCARNRCPLPRTGIVATESSAVAWAAGVRDEVRSCAHERVSVCVRFCRWAGARTRALEMQRAHVCVTRVLARTVMRSFTRARPAASGPSCTRLGGAARAAGYAPERTGGQVLDCSDVVVQVLDARDPAGTRSAKVEVRPAVRRRVRAFIHACCRSPMLVAPRAAPAVPLEVQRAPQAPHFCAQQVRPG